MDPVALREATYNREALYAYHNGEILIGYVRDVVAEEHYAFSKDGQRLWGAAHDVYVQFYLLCDKKSIRIHADFIYDDYDEAVETLDEIQNSVDATFADIERRLAWTYDVETE